MVSKKIKEIALERIDILFDLAKKEFKKHPERSNRYVKIAKKILMKIQEKMPRKHIYSYCKKCNSYLVIGENATKRKKKKFINLTCKNCGYTRKIYIEAKTLKGNPMLKKK